MGTFLRIVVGAVLLMTLAFPVVNLVTVPIGLYLLVSGVRRMWGVAATSDAR